MRQLIAYLNCTRTGILEQDDNGLLHFTYDGSWLTNTDAIPLSRSLPLQKESFRGKLVRPFFAGILPEESPRTKVAAILGISANNDFAMLERIGGECAGAVSLLPDDMTPPKPEDSDQRTLSEAELRNIIEELPRRPLMAGTEGLRLSLAGAQDKLPVIFNNGQFALPVGNTPSTHILKPEPERFPGLAPNEVYCMSLAKRIGLRVPEVHYIEIGDKPCILVERYDRYTDEQGTRQRIHQEDFCQALGYPPEQKYQAEGGPLLRDCISLLREWSTVPVLDIRDFIDVLILNAVIGNTDAHAKNFSMLYTGRERRLSPSYDLVCTLAWEELSTSLAMKIGTCKNIHDLTSAHWKNMADETGLGWPMIRDRINKLAANIPDKCAEAAQDLNIGSPMLQPVVDIITKRASKYYSPRSH